MRSLGLVVCFVLALPVAGCGSGSPSAFTLACALKTLPSGAIKSTVTITNNTRSPATAYLYGPAFSWISYIHPVSDPSEVVIQTPQGPQPFRGFTIRNITPQTPSQIKLQFRPPRSPQGIAVSATPRFQADDVSAVSDSDCQIKP